MRSMLLPLASISLFACEPPSTVPEPGISDPSSATDATEGRDPADAAATETSETPDPPDAAGETSDTPEPQDAAATETSDAPEAPDSDAPEPPSDAGASQDAAGLTAPTLVAEAAPVGTEAASTLGLRSSSRAEVRWSAPGAAAVRIVLETGDHATARVEVGAQGVAAFDSLPSDATLTVRAVACADAACTVTGPEAVATFELPEETWQLVGSGEALAGLSTVASDGQAKIWGHIAGPEAGAAYAGRVVLYYGTAMRPPDIVGQTLGVATGARVLSADDPGSWAPLTLHPAAAGFVSPQPRGTPVGDIMTGQGVPLRSGGVRLYFESNAADGKTRILSVTSADGLVGLDFNTSPNSSLCRTPADYAAGGSCEARLEVEAAATPGPGKVPKVQNVRQFKLGFPTRDDWRWDEAAGTFMFVTLDRGGACNYPGFANQGYLVWSGTSWDAALRADGCPAVLPDAQAPAPVHLGGVRYKLYHGTPGDRTGAGATMLPFLGPKRVRYADGARTGDPGRVDFDDWEATPRETRWIWPNGRQLTPTEEGYIDDFVFLAPTDAFQLAYVVITDGTAMPRPAVAVLRNP